MDNRIHFISGLPQSRSTMLSATLWQNPRFHAMMTSAAGGIYLSMPSAISRKNEAAVFFGAARKRELLRGVLGNYYHSIGAGKVVFDMNRLGLPSCRL